MSLIIRSVGGDENNEMIDWATRMLKQNMIAIIQSKPFGGILGTLDFGTAKARQLIALGYKDTLQHLAKIAIVHEEDYVV